MKATIKMLVVVDLKVDLKIDYLDDVKVALERQRDDYREATDDDLDVIWDILPQDLSNLSWVEYGYGKDNYGVDIGWLKNDIQTKPDYYSVAYVIDESNWTKKGNQGIWGWSISLPNQSHIQLVKGQKGKVTSMYYTFLMELMHSWDNLYFKVTRKRLEDVFMVSNYDEDIIHGRLPEYDAFKYVDVIRKMKDILIDLFRINKQTKPMYGQLIKDPSGNGKVWFVRKKRKSHVDNSEFLKFVWRWEEVKTISKDKFDAMEVVGPIGFKISFLQQIIKIIKKS